MDIERPYERMNMSELAYDMFDYGKNATKKIMDGYNSMQEGDYISAENEIATGLLFFVRGRRLDLTAPRDSHTIPKLTYDINHSLLDNLLGLENEVEGKEVELPNIFLAFANTSIYGLAMCHNMNNGKTEGLSEEARSVRNVIHDHEEKSVLHNYKSFNDIFKKDPSTIESIFKNQYETFKSKSASYHFPDERDLHVM